MVSAATKQGLSSPPPYAHRLIRRADSSSTKHRLRLERLGYLIKGVGNRARPQNKPACTHNWRSAPLIVLSAPLKLAPRRQKDILFDCETRRVIKFVLHTNFPGHFDFGIYNRCNFKVVATSDRVEFSTFSKFEEFSHIFHGNADEVSKPVVLNRNCSGAENPFGSTLCYGTDQVIVEVMDNPQHIASVIIYEGKK
ncbi:hypothetical protein L596_006824 [Steinernema carpocapsae]|uniref:Uncharacterized protein n=1 Tax=Steinernema carpocapsae TaxID=34508 RepID=A0A4U5P756_STECR|nr:hypothetical protein L596_006824 [Steinernema carpocapsae]